MRNNVLKVLCVFSMLLLVCSFLLAASSKRLSVSQPEVHAMAQGDKQRASEAADRFLMRFRETLDFGTVFDDMGSSNAMLGLRNTKFFEEFRFNPDLVHRLDDATLRRAYKAMMNVYYLGMLYNSKCEGTQSNKLPKDIEALLRESKFSDAEDSDDNRPRINTTQDLEEYISLNNRLAALYKKQLSPDVFDSPAYKKKFPRLEEQRGKDHVAFNNYESFGVPKGSPVYLAQRDFFSIALVEEAGEMKVIRLGIGN